MGESEREPSLADEKWARIAAECGDTCVWHRDGGGTCAEELPINPGLIAALDGWCAWYGCDCEDFMPPHARDPALRFDAGAHREVGLILARAVKAQLPDWTIVFGFSSNQAMVLTGGALLPLLPDAVADRQDAAPKTDDPNNAGAYGWLRRYAERDCP